MPIIKSAIKRMRQAAKRRERNFPLRSELKTSIKKVIMIAKEGKKEEVEKALKGAYSVIDKALKKNLIHRNNAARKKSRMARLAAGMDKK